jgi:hypothetical protein
MRCRKREVENQNLPLSDSSLYSSIVFHLSIIEKYESVHSFSYLKRNLLTARYCSSCFFFAASSSATFRSCSSRISSSLVCGALNIHTSNQIFVPLKFLDKYRDFGNENRSTTPTCEWIRCWASMLLRFALCNRSL